MKNLITESSNQLCKMTAHLKEFLVRSFEHDEHLLLFAADEAKELLDEKDKDAFYYFRSMIREMMLVKNSRTSVYFFGIVMDTYGQLANFLPTKETLDPSLRPFQSEARLYDPLCLLQFRREKVPEWWMTKSKNEWMSNMYSLVVNQGRFLWYAYRNHLSLAEMIDYGVRKLLGGQMLEDYMSNQNTDLISMAILGSRVAISYPATEKQSFEMVRSYMGISYFLDQNQGLLVYGYPSEPLLSLSASVLLRDNTKSFSWERSLAHVLPIFRKVMVGAGFRGEFICRVLLSVAWDKCQSPKESLHVPITVSTFLAQLGGEKLVDAVSQSSKLLLNGRLYFTHFVYLSYAVTTEDQLMKLLAHGQAVLCRTNQQAIDLLIPVILSDNRRFSFIAIQCRNRVDNRWSDAANVYDIRKIGFDDSFISPYLVLCMQVASVPKPGIQTLCSMNRGKKTIVAMNGLSPQVFPFLENESLFAVITQFQPSWQDVITLFESRQRFKERDMLLRVMQPTYEEDS